MNQPIILASASPRRREILTWAGIPFEVCPSESEYAPEGLPPAQRVRELAKSKATQVAQKHPCRLILAADTMVALDGEMLGKPHSEAEAVEMLMRLQGREHTVYTGVWVIQTDETGAAVQQDGFTDETTVRFFPMTEEDARQYVATGEPMDKAGAYGIQGYGLRYIQGVVGDYYTVMGLPGGRLVRFLQNFPKNPCFNDKK